MSIIKGKIAREDIQYGSGSFNRKCRTGFDISVSEVIDPSVEHNNDGTHSKITKVTDPYYDIRAGLPDGFVTDGSVDYATEIAAAHATGKEVHYPAGTWQTTAANLTLTGGVKLYPGAVVKNSYYNDILAFDSDGATLVGLHHNHTQSTSTAAANTIGNIVAPPMSKAHIVSDVDIVAHWYNDFGLEYTRLGGGAATWYTWAWNHTNTASSEGYLADRHPLLGWYRGDDQNVLDWQCYWLKEHGINNVILNPASALDTATWDTASDHFYWLYQLMENVPNFKGLRYALFMKYTGSNAEITAQWEHVVDNVYLVYRNFYALNIGGKLYPVLYVFEGSSLYNNLGNTQGDMTTLLTNMAGRFQTAGYGGVALFVRNNFTIGDTFRSALEKAGAYVFGAGYSSTDSSDLTSYQDAIDTYGPTASQHKVWNVFTSRKSHSAHTSSFDTPGHTPALFEKLLRKAVDWVRSNERVAKIITIYNVAEWAEGGPGLQPNMQDGFGYLEAVRNAITGSPRVLVTPTEVHRQNITAGSATIVTSPSHCKTVVLQPTANRTMTSTPTLEAGYDGQEIELVCSNVHGAYTVTIQDNGTLADSDLFLTANTIVLAAWDSVRLRYLSDKGGWVQTRNGDIITVSADKGDAAATLTVGLSEQTNIWNTALGADRAVTLSTTGAYNGAKFRIVRTANATGAYNLNVGTGPLKALAAGTWCEVEYNGSAWMLTAYGTL